MPMQQSSKHIYFLGIGGTLMGSLAQLAKESGYRVSGSDKALYPPMSDQLAAAGRRIQGAVVETVLTRKEELPEGEQAEFCLEVHRCLCDSWSRSGFKSDCCPDGCARKTTTKGNKEQ